MTKFLNIDLDTKLGGSAPSDVLVSSQKAIKTYVDSKLLEETTRAQGAEAGLDTRVSGIEAKIPDSASADNKLATQSDLENVGVAIDGTTITKKADGKIQASAIVNQNTATGSTNPVFDWVGTLAEYQAQNIETLHPDWLCYITDDVSGGESVYTKSQVDSLLALKVSTGHEVIESQAPTAANNYTWYRKYADGWVEQGGVAPAEQNYQVTLPFQMYNNNYYVSITGFSFSGSYNAAIHNVRNGTKTTTGFQIQCRDYNNANYITSSTWEVKGVAA